MAVHLLPEIRKSLRNFQTAGEVDFQGASEAVAHTGNFAGFATTTLGTSKRIICR
jgi:hypothetical protein